VEEEGLTEKLLLEFLDYTVAQLQDVARFSVTLSASENPHNMMRYRGDWEAGLYLKDDVVRDGGALYIALTRTANPTSNTDDWAPL
jgi:hypothetical protein